VNRHRDRADELIANQERDREDTRRGLCRVRGHDERVAIRPVAASAGLARR